MITVLDSCRQNKTIYTHKLLRSNHLIMNTGLDIKYVSAYHNNCEI